MSDPSADAKSDLTETGITALLEYGQSARFLLRNSALQDNLQRTAKNFLSNDKSVDQTSGMMVKLCFLMTSLQEQTENITKNLESLPQVESAIEDCLNVIRRKDEYRFSEKFELKVPPVRVALPHALPLPVNVQLSHQQDENQIKQTTDKEDETKAIPSEEANKTPTETIPAEGEIKTSKEGTHEAEVKTSMEATSAEVTQAEVKASTEEEKKVEPEAVSEVASTEEVKTTQAEEENKTAPEASPEDEEVKTSTVEPTREEYQATEETPAQATQTEEHQATDETPAESNEAPPPNEVPTEPTGTEEALKTEEALQTAPEGEANGEEKPTQEEEMKTTDDSNQT